MFGAGAVTARAPTPGSFTRLSSERPRARRRPRRVPALTHCRSRRQEGSRLLRWRHASTGLAEAFASSAVARHSCVSSVCRSGHPTPPDRSAAAVAETWHQHRKRVLDVAYRMLGSVHDAEDVVQEAYSRLLAVDIESLDDVRGWLVTVTSRLCIDRLRSHERVKRACVGPWLPEPIVDRASANVDPADRITLDDTVRMALMVVLEELSPPRAGSVRAPRHLQRRLQRRR